MDFSTRGFDMNDEKGMRVAIAAARRGLKSGGGPFGCAIFRHGKLVASACNRVVKTNDATAHSEVRAIRLAGRKLGTPFLRDCTLYSTTEPCPMCYSACHWAKIKRVVYGSFIADAARFGLNELRTPAEKMKRIGYDKIELKGGVLRNECLELFKEWWASGGKPY